MKPGFIYIRPSALTKRPKAFFFLAHIYRTLYMMAAA
jgi:hypothetical protein